MIEMVFSYKLFNPLFWHIREAMHDKDIRYIINRGGSSSGNLYLRHNPCCCLYSPERVRLSL